MSFLDWSLPRLHSQNPVLGLSHYQTVRFHKLMQKHIGSQIARTWSAAEIAMRRFPTSTLVVTHVFLPTSESDQVSDLRVELELLKKEFQAYKDEKQQEEAKKLRTALIAAGGIIIALGGFVWAEIIWPVISSGYNKP